MTRNIITHMLCKLYVYSLVSYYANYATMKDHETNTTIGYKL